MQGQKETIQRDYSRNVQYDIRLLIIIMNLSRVLKQCGPWSNQLI